MSHQLEPADRVAMVEGRRLHYLECGAGEPLVLMHSNGGSAYEYEEMFSLLAPRFRVIAWDMPGHGDSDPLERHLSVDEYADRVVKLLDALGLDRAHVLGASIGGAITISLAARHRKRLLRYVIAECPFRTQTEWAATWLTTETNYSQPTQTREKIAPRVREVTDHLLTRWNIDRNKAGTKTMLSVMWALREYDIASALAQIGDDARLIFGDRGPTVAKIDLFRTALRDPEIFVLENVGHFPMLDDPPAFLEAIVALVDREAK